jgi:hypothetical protein
MYQPPALREHDATRPVSRLSQTSSASTAGGGRSTPSTQHSKVDVVDPAITLQDLLLLLQVRLACTYSYIPRHHAARPAAATPGASLYICPHTAVYVSSCYYLCVLIPLYMCPYTTIYLAKAAADAAGAPVCPHASASVYLASAYSYISSGRIPVYMCPHAGAPVYLASTYSSYISSALIPLHICPHTTMCPHTTICVLILLYVSSIGVLFTRDLSLSLSTHTHTEQGAHWSVVYARTGCQDLEQLHRATRALNRQSQAPGSAAARYLCVCSMRPLRSIGLLLRSRALSMCPHTTLLVFSY